MPLTTVRQEIASRFTEAQAFLTAIKLSEEPTSVQPQDINTRKGLFLVLLYSAVEYAVNRSVLEYTQVINNTDVKFCHINESLYSLALDSQLTSCAMVGKDHLWSRRVELFRKQTSSEKVKLSESAFLEHLENIWTKTIFKIFSVLGLQDNALYNPRVAQYVNEVVERRNAVAHGRDAAENVGQGYTTGRLQTLHDELSIQVQYMVACFENHLDGKLFISNSHKDKY